MNQEIYNKCKSAHNVTGLKMQIGMSWASCKNGWCMTVKKLQEGEPGGGEKEDLD
jgi:hypothetical protein